MSNQDYDLTLLYCRLSREDALEGDSNSIENQKKIVLKAAQDYNFDNLVWLIDDGFTGTNFDRPDFQKGMKLIEEGRVKNFITKDLSRLGRNYLEVGMYTDVIFPKYNVRFIAVHDNYDSNNVESNDMAPIVNLFNEWHPKETSKKVRAVFKAKAERGERVSSQVPYGYSRDESTPIGSKKSIKLVIDEESAKVVREIYKLCASGLGPTFIANILKERKILKPSMYSYEKNGKYGAVTDVTEPYGWNGRTVADILDNEVYIGNTINLKGTTVSYKNKRRIKRPEEEWIRVEGTHESIIDMDTWEIVRRVREGKRRRDSMDGINKYSGLLYCADCGQKLYFVRGKTIKPEALKSAATNTDKFVALAKKHIHIEELTPEVLLTFVSKIVIHERSEKWSKGATQQIDIYFTHIGNAGQI